MFKRAMMLCLGLGATALATDWPQWMGPNRDGTWPESGLVERFPEQGLKVTWRVPIGLGYAGPAAANGKVYVTDYAKESGSVANNPGTRDNLTGKERILCLDAKTGAEVWVYAYDRDYAVSYGAGPRATPAIASGKLVALGAEGDLVCLDAEKGELIWKKQLKADYNAPTPLWGFSGHPLIDGDTVYALVGGPGSVAVAFDLETGKEKWKSLSASESGYCPPTMIEHGGVKQLLIWHPEALNSLNPENGEVYWSQTLKPAYAMAIAAPRLAGNLLFASGMGKVGALYKLSGGKPSAELVWEGGPKSALYAVNSTPVVVGDVIYGVDGDKSELMAVSLKDGKRLWTTMEPTLGAEGKRGARHGTAFLVKNGDRFFIFSETGDLILAKLTPERYEEISRFHVIDPTSDVWGRKCVWSHPAFANKSIYARSDKELVAVSLAK